MSKAIVGPQWTEKEVSKPELRPTDVLVEVHGVATNPVDALVLTWDGKEDKIAGFDFSGVVREVGSEAASSWKVGDEVWGSGDFTRQGCFADFVAVDHRIISRKPSNLDHASAAAVPLTALTAWEGITEVAGLKSGAGKSILVIAGAGGVGSIAIQLAKKVLQFDTVVATASRDTTVAYCKEMGADHVINHREDMAAQLKALGLENGADVVFNCVGADANFEQLPALTAPLGSVVLISGPEKPVTITPFMVKRISIGYELMFSRPMLSQRPEEQGEVLARFARWVELGIIDARAVKEQRFARGDLAKAQELQKSGKAMGKITLTWKE